MLQRQAAVHPMTGDENFLLVSLFKFLNPISLRFAGLFAHFAVR